ncbi:MAG TPA: response regulator [Bacteroidia bacterium]|nr:response regulator [Bacteroidia bacterium]
MEKRKILVIEDNLEMRENIVEILELAGYSVLSAPNGKEGVSISQNEKPDLIICDIMMPELDGYGVLKILSKSPETYTIPFIFLTAKAEKSDIRQGMMMGADDYLTKPFDANDLLQAIEIRLEKSKNLKKEYSSDLDGFAQFIDEAKGYEEMIKLSSDRRVRSFKKKEIVFSEGDHCNGMYFVASGKVKTYMTNTDGKELISGVFTQGDFFGFMPLLESQSHNDSSETMENSELIFIPKEDFYSLLFTNRDVSARFIKILSKEIIEKEERLLQLAYNSVRKRVADALLKLYDKFEKSDQKDHSFVISRDDLSNIVGTSTETLIRTLSDFKQEKIVELKGSLITILDIGKLTHMKN